MTNQYVTLSNRHYLAIRQETVLTLTNFLKQRINTNQNNALRDIYNVFRATKAEDMAMNARPIIENMKMGSVLELTDDCVDLFAKLDCLKEETMSVSARFHAISKVSVLIYFTIVKIGCKMLEL